MISSESINNYMKKDIFIRQSCRTPSLLSFLLNNLNNPKFPNHKFNVECNFN